MNWRLFSAGTSISARRYAPATISASSSKNAVPGRRKLRDGAILAAGIHRIAARPIGRSVTKTATVKSVTTTVTGMSKRRAFIRTPIKRLHESQFPLQTRDAGIRCCRNGDAQRGRLRGAQTGTPVKATGDGRVTFRGTKGGYGKTVIVEHASKYTTLYAHLSKRSARAAAIGSSRDRSSDMSVRLAPPLAPSALRISGCRRPSGSTARKLPKTLTLAKSEIATFRKATAP